MSTAAPSPVRPRRPRTITSSRRDMAMLRVAPIESAPLPRVHASPRQTAGSLRVLDRAGGQEVLVYTPVFRSQFESGHRAGRWYVRPAATVGGAPCSLGFDTAREAVEAVAADAWRLRVVSDGRPSASPLRGGAGARPRLRVFWKPEAARA